MRMSVTDGRAGGAIAPVRSAPSATRASGAFAADVTSARAGATATGAAIDTGMAIDGATSETSGRISRTANAPASQTWRTAARLRRARRVPARASAVTSVAFAR